ncbi:MAG TPA: hypothetical protein VJ995_02135 [Geothermobacteraceae bacterium]|nr:hypothetical protein [Geothermobacteraceae bacterium]
MPPIRLLILLTCSLALTHVTACAPQQPLSNREKQAGIERLQRLKSELAALKAELAETKARERQLDKVPVAAAPQPSPRPAWISWTGSDPLPTSYDHHVMLLAGKVSNPDAVNQVITELESLQSDPAVRLNDHTLFIVPSLTKMRVFSRENYDHQKAEALLGRWPGSTTGIGPFLLIKPEAPPSDPAGRILLDLNGLSGTELRSLLQRLSSLADRNTANLLTTLLRERPGVPARVTSLGNDFSIGWPR